MNIPGVATFKVADRWTGQVASSSKAMRHILTAVLAWSLACLTACLVALMVLALRHTLDMAVGTVLGGAFTVFAGLATICVRAIVIGAKLSDGPTPTQFPTG